ncbi:MAG: SUMF1/EgtB/PvdO family nonheme iron enzyme [Candidatus Limimorpha sp.]
MRIKTRLIITVLAMMLSMAAFGQSPIKVKEFRMLPNGIMDAGVLTKEQQTDYDGNKVCLIKVRASGIGEETMQRLSFKTNGPFITHKEYENGEYRLYVSSNREGSIVIRYNGDCEYMLPSRLKEGKIYEMVLEMETGTLTVVATPVEAKIYVDDAYAGTGSVNVQVSVGAEHRCRVECQDYIKVEKTVSFAKNEEKTLTVELVPNFGYITVKSEPSGAEVYIDNKKAGTTPYLAMRISRGQHRVEVRKRSYEPYADVVTININETTRIEDVKLEASNEVTSIPQQQEQYSPQQEYGGGFSNQTITVNGVSFEMVYVEGGTFDMGATSEQGSDADSDEKPVHSVTLSGYYIGKCEVTQELWEAVMGSNPSNFKGAQNPVESVSWNDCQEFVSRLNSLTGRTFRLPTEAEWEYAARGGNKSRHYKYSGSNNIFDVAWHDGNSFKKTHAVGTKTANELGIYDMSGNVWEWCSDWYGGYSAGAQTNPQGPSSGSYRVLRGGSWNYDARDCRVSNRSSSDPSYSLSSSGLRLVLVP